MESIHLGVVSRGSHKFRSSLHSSHSLAGQWNSVGHPFLLWISDLSAPDTLIELPFTIPLIFTQIDAIRLLPIINGLTTWLQQKFVGNMTPTTDSTQMKLMQFMPIIFIFIFYNWASGFVLYWLCNNVFTIAQQYLQNRSATDEEQMVSTDTKKTEHFQTEIDLIHSYTPHQRLHCRKRFIRGDSTCATLY